MARARKCAECGSDEEMRWFALHPSSHPSCFAITSFTEFKMAAQLSQLFNRFGQRGVGVRMVGGVLNSALFNIDGGHRAVMFDR